MSREPIDKAAGLSHSSLQAGVLPTCAETGLLVRDGVFVSDLHLFSPRSAAHDIQRALLKYRDPASCIILGGDIFDFRWSDLGSHANSLREAQSWLEYLITHTGEAQIVYLPGNHDCHPDFLTILKSLAEHHPRFRWQPHHVQIGSSLFLHGDILDAGGSLQDLNSYRSRFHHQQPQTRLAQRSYDLAVGLRVHKMIPKLRHQPRNSCARLLTAIEGFELHNRDAVRRIYFGHTHVAVQGHKLDGIEFYNPGAGLRHMQLLPLVLDFEADSVLPPTT